MLWEGWTSSRSRDPDGSPPDSPPRYTPVFATPERSGVGGGARDGREVMGLIALADVHADDDDDDDDDDII